MGTFGTEIRTRKREKDRSVGNEVVARRECYLRGTNRVQENITFHIRCYPGLDISAMDFADDLVIYFFLTKLDESTIIRFALRYLRQIYIYQKGFSCITNLIQGTTSNLIT